MRVKSRWKTLNKDGCFGFETPSGLAQITPDFAVLALGGGYKSRGEVILSKRGLEGSGIYTLSPALRERRELFIDIAPNLTIADIAVALQQPKDKNSLSNFLRKTLRLPPVKIALLQELARPLPADPAALTRAI